MRIGIIPGMLVVCCIGTLHAQDPDSLRSVSLSEIVVKTTSICGTGIRHSIWMWLGKNF